jgi:hypothetical protein
MIAPIDKVRGEGNCGRVTNRGEEACECVRKCRPEFAAGRILTKAARLRTETSYKAGSGRRVSTTSRSRSQTPVQVNGELVQRSITLLSARDLHSRHAWRTAGTGRRERGQAQLLTRGRLFCRLLGCLEQLESHPVEWFTMSSIVVWAVSRCFSMMRTFSPLSELSWKRSKSGRCES